MLQTAYRIKHVGQGPTGLVKVQEAIPTPQAHEVLVRVHAVAINYRDIAITTGTYGMPIKDEVVLGGDLAGDVVVVGDAVSRFKAGDRILSVFDQENLYGPMKSFDDVLGGPIDGALQEYIVLRETSLLPIPTHLSYEEASCLPIAGVTAWNVLYGGDPLLPGQTVVFQGTGGVSIVGLMLAHAAGATTIITSSSDEKLALAKKLGATHTINYKKNPDWDKVVKELTNGVGAQHIFDNVGINDIERCFNSVSRGGTISTIGWLGGKVNTSLNVPLLALFTGSNLRGINAGSKQLFEDLLRFMEAKELRPYVDKIFPFDRTVEALQYVERGEHFGKVVIRVSPTDPKAA